MKKKISIIIGIIIIGIFGFSVFSLLNKPKEQDMLITAEVTKTEKQKMITTIDADGTVAFRDKVSIYAKNTGKVSNIPINEGDSVNQGDIIINYDKASLETLQRQLEDAKLSLKSANLALQGLMLPADESQLKQLEAQISQSEKAILDLENNLVQLDKDIAKAQTDLDGANVLYSQGAISQTEYNNFQTALTNLQNQKTSSQNSLDATKKQLEANKSQYDSAKNKNSDPNMKNKIDSQKVMVQQAQLRVNQLTEDINDFEIATTSPITGTLIKIHVTDGEAVSEGKIVAEVGDLNDLVIESYIPEYDMDGLSVGQEVLIKSDTTEEELKGQVTKIYPVAELSKDNKNVVKIEVSIPEGSPLKAGYSANLTITTKIDDNALVIPIMSYMSEKLDGKNSEYVFVVKEDGTLEKRAIKIKNIKNSVASVEGIAEGEKVVSSPTETMKDGMKINPLESMEEQQAPAK